MKRFHLLSAFLLFTPFLFSCAGAKTSPPAPLQRTASTSLTPTGTSLESSNPSLQESPYRDLEQIEEGKIVHIPTGVEIPEQRLIDLLAPARVIYVGEVHDSPEDHRVQLEIVKRLLERFPGKVAVGMEMFRRPAQPQLDRWIQGKLEGKEFYKLWYENWGMDLSYYEPLLDFIQKNKIPLIALNTSQEMETKVGMKGLKGLSEEDRKELPEMDRNDPYHRKALEAIFKGHGPGGENFDPFYDTMLLWDETMAESVANYLSSPAGADKKIVVLAGGFHIGYGFGIPRRAFRRLPEPYQIVLPYTREIPKDKRRMMMEVTAPDLPLILGDFVWAVAYKEPENKTVRLGVQIEPFQAGIRVLSVSPDSAAEAAGIEPGDIVLSFDGKTMQEPSDLTYAVRQKGPGDQVKVRIIRDGKPIETEVTLKTSRHP
jgi:uncharacterized iron-regulated protein